MTEGPMWRRCSACKEPIALGAVYWTCSVSTCNRKRTALAFCSVSCWDAHLPVARHREAWAVEETAPTRPEAPGDRAPAASTPAKQGKARVVRTPASSEAPASATQAGATAPDEVLIVASRLKEFIRAESGFNTSDRVLGPLSDILRRVCREAIRSAERNERKTVLDRDIPKS